MTERYAGWRNQDLRPSVLQDLERIKKSKEAVLSLLTKREEKGKNKINPEKLVNSIVRKLHTLEFKDGYSVNGDAVKGAIGSLLAGGACHFSPMNEIVLGPMPERR
ncbi:MAG TPA: hypothetical protein VKC54_03425 [Patescibacteria group bacterium]|nr:hypothetical protein [Patescibacteria group bacterium]